MDSWTPAQIGLMNAGGNDKCNSFLQSKGVPKTASIKEKYESDAAALYKEVLKARAEGRPEPTELVKKAPKKAAAASMGGVAGGGGGGGGGGSNDPNGMERLMGETDEQYIARQTRLREEARKRMAAKFGSSGMNGKRTMGGVGSSPHPSQSSSSFNMDALGDTLSSGLGTAASGFSSAFSFAKETVNSTSSKYSAKDVSNMGMGLWNSLSSGAKEVANTMNLDTSTLSMGSMSSSGGDGLSALQQRMQRERSARSGGVNYSGFGSDSMSNSMNSTDNTGIGNGTTNMNGSNMQSTRVATTSASTAQSNNDPNSVAPLEGETNEQYMERQVRIRNEAKAKLAAGTRSGTVSQMSAKKNKPVVKMKVDAGDDFFANFGA